MLLAEVKTCCECGGQIIYGEKPHAMNDLDWSTRKSVMTYWCMDCIDAYSAILWDEETKGPRISDIFRGCLTQSVQ